MYFTVFVVVMLVSVCDSHPGEPQSWIAAVSELLEKMIKTELKVQAMHQEVTTGLKAMAEMKTNMENLRSLANKTGLYSFDFSLQCKFSQNVVLINVYIYLY